MAKEPSLCHYDSLGFVEAFLVTKYIWPIFVFRYSKFSDIIEKIGILYFLDIDGYRYLNMLTSEVNRSDQKTDIKHKQHIQTFIQRL